MEVSLTDEPDSAHAGCMLCELEGPASQVLLPLLMSWAACDCIGVATTRRRRLQWPRRSVKQEAQPAHSRGTVLNFLLLSTLSAVAARQCSSRCAVLVQQIGAVCSVGMYPQLAGMQAGRQAGEPL